MLNKNSKNLSQQKFSLRNYDCFNTKNNVEYGNPSNMNYFHLIWTKILNKSKNFFYSLWKAAQTLEILITSSFVWNAYQKIMPCFWIKTVLYETNKDDKLNKRLLPLLFYYLWSPMNLAYTTPVLQMITINIYLLKWEQFIQNILFLALCEARDQNMKTIRTIMTHFLSIK